MTSTLARLRGGPLTPFDWTNLSLFPLFTPVIKIEDYRDGDRYVVRAELPGIDPERDVRVMLVDGALKLHLERVEDKRVEDPKDRMRSEFHYGNFYRSIPLPLGVREDSIRAEYDKGILTVTMLIGETEPGKNIPIQVGTSVR